jgi:hypothetical protein
MVLLWVWMGVCFGVCPVDPLALAPGLSQKHTWRLEREDTVVDCREIVLGQRSTLRIDKLKVRLKQWDDTHKRLGLSRVTARGGHWVLQLPELRHGDALSIRLWGQGLAADAVWASGDVADLGPPIETAVTWSDGGAMVPGPSGSLVRRMEQTWRIGPTAASRRQVWLPEGVHDTHCTARADDVELTVSTTGQGCAFDTPLADQLEVRVSWEEHGASATGEWWLEAGESLMFTEDTIAWAGLEPSRSTEGLVFAGPGWVTVQLSSLAGRDVVVNALAEVETGARYASIPEPGLGLSYKGREGGLEMVDEITALVQEQLQNGTLRGIHPLKPRPLMAVRRSGWGTPWEQALILARYLGQIGLTATAFPVRPTERGEGLMGAPEGYTGAVVRAIDGAETVWVDPSCRACTIGQLSPSLAGGAIFGGGVAGVRSVPQVGKALRLDDEG